ncbi:MULTISPECIES: phosphotransferase family protein [Paenibacillus]|uniref:phosphotransferase family protein n=2 Tax=Paenibacillus TaxID=44249 RepID=UPI00351B9D6B
MTIPKVHWEGCLFFLKILNMKNLMMKQQLCHGDPNPGNILLRDHDTVIIDWNNASTGNPEADLGPNTSL